MATLNKRYLLLLALRIIINRRGRRRFVLIPNLRKVWVCPLFCQREEFGSYNILFKELWLNDREQFFRYFHMSPESLDYLLQLVEPHIRKNKTKFRDPISPEVRLALVLRYLASGKS